MKVRRRAAWRRFAPCGGLFQNSASGKAPGRVRCVPLLVATTGSAAGRSLPDSAVLCESVLPGFWGYWMEIAPLSPGPSAQPGSGWCNGRQPRCVSVVDLSVSSPCETSLYAGLPGIDVPPLPAPAVSLYKTAAANGPRRCAFRSTPLCPSPKSNSRYLALQRCLGGDLVRHIQPGGVVEIRTYVPTSHRPPRWPASRACISTSASATPHVARIFASRDLSGSRSARKPTSPTFSSPLVTSRSPALVAAGRLCAPCRRSRSTIS